MSKHYRIFAFAQLAYIVIVWAVLRLLPGADVLSTTAAMAGVWIAVASVYQRTSSRSLTGWWTLLIATTLLAVGTIANIHFFTVASGGATTTPVLENPDVHRYFLDALHHAGLEGGQPEWIDKRGYGLTISLLWRLTGVTIVSPLIMNMFMILLSIIISGVITARLMSNGRDSSHAQRLAATAMIMTAAVCYYLNSGTLLLKEAGTCLALALSALALTSVINPQSGTLPRIKSGAAFLGGIILLCFMRYNYILIVLVGALLVTSWRNRKSIMQTLPFIAICLAAWGVMTLIFSNYITANTGVIIDGENIRSYFFFDNGQHRFYNNMIGDYLSYPAWKRILLLPVSAVTQYLVPFPWNFSRDLTFGYTLAYAHITYPWYLVGGMILYFLVTGWRTASRGLRKYVFVGALMWLIPAYLFAGTVSRYALPMLPMLIPAAVHVFSTCRNNRNFRIYGITYCTLLAITLVTCHYLQQSAIN